MKFETPYVEVKKFDIKDILTASESDPTEPECPEFADCTSELPLD